MARQAFSLILLIAFSSSAAADEKQMTFSGRSVAWNGNSFRLPCHKDEVVKALGKPDRIEKLANDIYIWDRLGCFAYVRPGGNEAFSFNVALADMTRFLKFAPRTGFAGKLVVDGATIDPRAEIDAINRAKKGNPFKSEFVRYTFRAEGEDFAYFLNRGTPAGFVESGPFIELSIEWIRAK
jgi:hypothetical protein